MAKKKPKTFFGKLIKGVGDIAKGAIANYTGVTIGGGAAEAPAVSPVQQPIVNPLASLFPIPEGSFLDGIKKTLNEGLGVKTSVDKDTLLPIFGGLIVIILLFTQLNKK